MALGVDGTGKGIGRVDIVVLRDLPPAGFSVAFVAVEDLRDRGELNPGWSGSSSSPERGTYLPPLMVASCFSPAFDIRRSSSELFEGLI